MELKRKIAAVVTTGALLFSSFATPAFAATTIEISGNGSDSENTAKVTTTNTTYVEQSNDANISNNVDVDADTGKNDANDNTGGDVSVETGDVDVDVEIDNMVNFNVADVDCVCLLSDLLAKISGNGSDSDNKIKAYLDETLAVFQGNCAEENDGPHTEGGGWNRDKCGLDNDVDVDADTGKNDAEDNTGTPEGDPSVETGNADVDVNLDNSGNVNVFGEAGDLELPDFDFDFDLDISLDLSDLLGALLGLLG